MKRILIYGLKEPVGGLEKIITSYADRFQKEEVFCDYVIFGNSFSLEESIREKGGKVFYLPNRIKHRKEYKKRFESIFTNQHYDAVWANLAGLTNLDVLKLAKKHGVPIRVVHSHNARLFWSGRVMKYPVIFFHTIHKPKIDKYATDFWACSQIAGEFLFPKKLHHKIQVINNAVDTSVFCVDDTKRSEIRRELNIENNLVVGHVARISPEKNQSFMLEIFKELLSKRSDAKLLFVGDGDLKEQLVEKAKALGIIHSVFFVGFQNDVSGYCKASDVFLLPSISEGLGLSLIEAQACGVPCVASKAVPEAADITGCVKFVGLNESPKVWCDAILEMSDKKIENPLSSVKAAGYDIQTESEKICRFFITGDFESEEPESLS